MAAVPGGKMTRGQILTDALVRAGNNTLQLQQEVRIKLNRFLAELYLNWDWPFLYTSINVSLGQQGSFDLPDDFLKTQDDWALTIVNIQGNAARSRVSEVDRMTFEGALKATNSVQAARAAIYTIDRSAGVALYYPSPTPNCLATFRYKFLPPDVDPGAGSGDPITTLYNDDIPIFPWSNYLTDVVLEYAYGYESDPRQSQQKADNNEFLKTLRGATFPPHSVMPTGPGLDPDVFGPTFSGEGWGWPWQREW